MLMRMPEADTGGGVDGLGDDWSVGHKRDVSI